MVNNLTIEQLERLKELSVMANEYNIAKNLNEKIKEMTTPMGWDCIVAVKGVNPHLYVYGIRILFNFGEKEMLCDYKEIFIGHGINNPDKLIEQTNSNDSDYVAKKFKIEDFREALKFMLS